MSKQCSVCGKKIGLLEKSIKIYDMQICSICGRDYVDFDTRIHNHENHEKCLAFYNRIRMSPCYEGSFRSYAAIRHYDIEQYTQDMTSYPKDEDCFRFDINIEGTEFSKLEDVVETPTISPFGIGWKTQKTSQLSIKFPDFCPVTLRQTTEMKSVILLFQQNSRSKHSEQVISFDIPCSVPTEVLSNYFSIWIMKKGYLSFLVRRKEYAEALWRINDFPQPEKYYEDNTGTGGQTTCRKSFFNITETLYYKDILIDLFEDDHDVVPQEKNTRNNVISNEPQQAVSPREQQDSQVTLNFEIEAIKRYKELLDEGIITEDEFTEKKKQIMGI